MQKTHTPTTKYKRKIITLEASIPKFKLHWKKKKFEFAAVTTFLKNIIDKILYVYTNDTTLPTFEKKNTIYVHTKLYGLFSNLIKVKIIKYTPFFP